MDDELLEDKYISELSFSEIIIYAVISVIIAQLWLIFFNNLIYNTVGISETSLFSNLVLLILFLFFFIFFLNNPITLRVNRFTPLTI